MGGNSSKSCKLSWSDGEQVETRFISLGFFGRYEENEELSLFTSSFVFLPTSCPIGRLEPLVQLLPFLLLRLIGAATRKLPKFVFWADRLSMREKIGLEPTLGLLLRSTFKRSLLEFSSLDPLTTEDPCSSEAEILVFGDCKPVGTLSKKSCPRQLLVWNFFSDPVLWFL